METIKESSSSRIKTVVRARPLSSFEASRNPKIVTQINAAESLLLLKDPENFTKTPESFAFDACYDDKTSQKAFYEDSCQKLVKSVIAGNNANIVTYGQSASGKTHTIIGPSYQPAPEDEGVLYRACDDLLENLDSKVATLQYSMLDLYQDEIDDLLSTSKEGKYSLVEQPDKSVVVKDATWLTITSGEEFRKIVTKAFAKRDPGNVMNARSYSAHSICKFLLTRIDPASGDKTTSMLSIFDLAGLEKLSPVADPKSTSVKGAVQTNQGLFAFRKVVSSLANKEKVTPYRDSKLTRLLKNFFVSSNSLLIVTVAQSEVYYKDTLGTLRLTQSFREIVVPTKTLKTEKMTEEKPEGKQEIGVFE